VVASAAYRAQVDSTAHEEDPGARFEDVTVHVYYDREDPVTVSTADELDAVLNRIADALQYQRDPVMAEITSADEQRVLQVGLGYPTFSVLQWYDLNDGTPGALVSEGTTDAAGFDGYNYGGTWTAFTADAAVPIEMARTAAQEFLGTNMRPSCISWREKDS
jgi:hypothetical protein